MARIRKLNPADVAGAIELLQCAEPRDASEDFRERSRKMLGAVAGREGLYVAEENGTLAGVVWFLAEPVFANGGLVILLAVRPELRRRGIARQLLGFTERKIFSQSQSVFFSISSRNGPALQFLEKMGYTKVSEIPCTPESGHTQPCDAQWILRKTTPGRKS